MPRTNPVTVGQVSHFVANYMLSLSPTDAVMFLKPLLTAIRIVRLRGKAGELLKELCIALDMSGNPETFWAVWEQFSNLALAIGSRLRDAELWKRHGISEKTVFESFSALVSSVFLNDMHWQKNQKWAPLENNELRFSEAFDRFGVFAFRRYVRFLGTIGGSLLPGAWPALSDCLNQLEERNVLDGFLTEKTQAILLRLLHGEVAEVRIARDDERTWSAVRHILNVLVDLGSAEAFRLREDLPRS